MKAADIADIDTEDDFRNDRIRDMKTGTRTALGFSQDKIHATTVPSLPAVGFHVNELIRHNDPAGRCTP